MSPLMIRNGFPMSHCNKCGFVCMDPLPTHEFLRTEVYSSKTGYQRHKPSNHTKSKPTERFQKMLDYVGRHPHAVRVLDVGCSSGEFLYFAQKQGLEAYGVEPNEQSAAVAIKDGLRVFNGFLHEANYKNDFFDFIVLGDVIEHAPDPDKMFQECIRILRPGGILFIETPNLDCYWSKSTFQLYRFFKVPWSSLEPPFHVCYFSPNNLDLLADHFSCSVIDGWYRRTPELKAHLGSIHLWKKFKLERSVSSLFSMILGFGTYTLAYMLYRAALPLLHKDFDMVRVYQKKIV